MAQMRGNRMALPYNSLGAEKGCNKQVFKEREEEERQAAQEGQGLGSPRSHSIIQRPKVVT